MRRLLLILAALSLTIGCRSDPPFTSGLRFGDQQVSAATLRHGARVYRKHCRTCHGRRGDGQGPYARRFHPPPRDFTLGRFKFTSVPAGGLPTDDDLMRIVLGGLDGTGMLPWDLPEADAAAVIQYIKTFSSAWRAPPELPIATSPDPWHSRHQAIRRGRQVYHGIARCWSCHPAYVSPGELKEMAGPGPVRDDLAEPAATPSDYGVPLLAPDFLDAPLRSGSTRTDIYRTIAAGLGGTGMPTWKGALPERDLWALVHFVDHLEERRALRMRQQAAGSR